MIKEIMHDSRFLAQKSSDADESDKQTALDLLETLDFHKDECVGMAANMIGIKKRIIAFKTPLGNMVMFNPVIISKDKPFNTKEGCLSLVGRQRPVKRYENIEVEYLDMDFKSKKRKFSGFLAQIIQHEIDHCNGILI